MAPRAAGRGREGRAAPPRPQNHNPQPKTLPKPRLTLKSDQGIGELDTAERVEAAAARVRRDIIFAASLYL